jgi:hypothetical protein
MVEWVVREGGARSLELVTLDCVEELETVAKDQPAPDAELAMSDQKVRPQLRVGLLVRLRHPRLQPGAQASELRHRSASLEYFDLVCSHSAPFSFR